MIVGLPVCTRVLNGSKQHQTHARYAEAVLHGTGALPILIPPLGEAMVGLLDTLDGLLLTGSPSNVHPDRYGGGASETPEWHDLERDHTTLSLIREAVDRGIPLLAICRGIQELNVALGGTLVQRVHVGFGKSDHRGKGDTVAERYAPAHPITVSGSLARIVGATAVMVNSVHGQAIDRPAPGLVVEATAPDGTIEAVAMPAAPGWLLGVQWHPESSYADNPHSVAIFRAFGDACRARRRA
jgi:putative glutamine amidotransferase